MRFCIYSIFAMQFMASGFAFAGKKPAQNDPKAWKNRDQDIGVIRRHLCKDQLRPESVSELFESIDKKEKKQRIKINREGLRRDIIQFAKEFPGISAKSKKIVDGMNTRNIEHYPIITQRYFAAKNYELTDSEWIGFCESAFGRTRDHDARSILAIGSYSSFFVGAAITNPVIAMPFLTGAIAFQIGRFGLGIRESLQNSTVLKDFSYNPQNAIFWNSVKIASEFGMMAAYGFGMPSVFGQIKNAGGLIPFITPINEGISTFVYGNVLSSIIYAIKLIESGQNPLKTPSYYTDSIANIIAYGSIGRAIGEAKSLGMYARMIPSAALLFAVMDDYMNQIAKRFDSKKMRDKHSQKYFTWWASTFTPANTYIKGVSKGLIHAFVPPGMREVIWHSEQIVRFYLYFSICYRTGAVVVGEEADFWPTVWREFRKWETYDPSKQAKVVNDAFREWMKKL